MNSQDLAPLDDEDADDVAIYDARKAALAAGADVRLSAEAAAALLRGASLAEVLATFPVGKA